MAAVVAIPFSRTASSHHHWYGARWFASFSSSHDLYRFIVRQSKDAPRGLWRDLVEIDDIDSDAFIHSTISCLKPYYLTAILFRVSYQTLAIINILASPFQFIQSPQTAPSSQFYRSYQSYALWLTHITTTRDVAAAAAGWLVFARKRTPAFHTGRRMQSKLAHSRTHAISHISP